MTPDKLAGAIDATGMNPHSATGLFIVLAVLFLFIVWWKERRKS